MLNYSDVQDLHNQQSEFYAFFKAHPGVITGKEIEIFKNQPGKRDVLGFSFLYWAVTLERYDVVKLWADEKINERSTDYFTNGRILLHSVATKIPPEDTEVKIILLLFEERFITLEARALFAYGKECQNKLKQNKSLPPQERFFENKKIIKLLDALIVAKMSYRQKESGEESYLQLNNYLIEKVKLQNSLNQETKVEKETLLEAARIGDIEFLKKVIEKQLWTVEKLKKINDSLFYSFPDGKALFDVAAENFNLDFVKYLFEQKIVSKEIFPTKVQQLIEFAWSVHQIEFIHWMLENDLIKDPALRDTTKAKFADIVLKHPSPLSKAVDWIETQTAEKQQALVQLTAAVHAYEFLVDNKSAETEKLLDECNQILRGNSASTTEPWTLEAIDYFSKYYGIKTCKCENVQLLQLFGKESALRNEIQMHKEQKHAPEAFPKTITVVSLGANSYTTFGQSENAEMSPQQKVNETQLATTKGFG